MMGQSKLAQAINDETIPEEDSAPGDFVAAVRDLEGTPEDVAIDLGQELADKAPLSTSGSNANGTWFKIYLTPTTGLLIQHTTASDMLTADISTGDIYRSQAAAFTWPLEFESLLSMGAFVVETGNVNDTIWAIQSTSNITLSGSRSSVSGIRVASSITGSQGRIGLSGHGTFDDSE